MYREDQMSIKCLASLCSGCVMLRELQRISFIWAITPPLKPTVLDELNGGLYYTHIRSCL